MTAEGKDFSQFLLCDSRGSGIVRVTHNQEIIIFFQGKTEILDIQSKIAGILQMIPGLSTSGKRKLPGIFRVGGTEYQRMPGIYSFNEKRNQFAGSVAGQNKVRGYATVLGQGISQ